MSTDAKRRPLWLTCLWAVTIASSLYALSIGPAYWCFSQGAYDSWEGFARFRRVQRLYAPILWVEDHSAIGPAIEWYKLRFADQLEVTP